MRKTLVLLAIASAMPLAAQSFEAGVFLGQQSYKSISASDGLGDSANLKPDSKTVVGLRVGYSLVDLGPALFEVTAGYQPAVSTPMKGTISGGGGSVSGDIGDLKDSNWSLGLMFNFKAFVAVGAGVEYRSEKLTDVNNGANTTYGRPWARVNVGLAFPTPLVKPFVGLEVAMPLASTSFDANDLLSNNEDNLLKSMAPKLQVGLYAGIRF